MAATTLPSALRIPFSLRFWQAGRWEPLGEALAVPTASTVSPTYDQTGVPWFLPHGPTATAGQVLPIIRMIFYRSSWESTSPRIRAREPGPGERRPGAFARLVAVSAGSACLHQG
jgi:hypothetical protein